MQAIRFFAAWAVAVAATAALGAAIATQFVLARLEAAGAGAIPLADRARATLADIAGLGPLYAGFLALPLALGFALASLAPFRGIWRFGPFKLAGAFAVVATLVALQSAFPAQPISGAKGALGFLGQAAAGACGGALFAALFPARRTR